MSKRINISKINVKNVVLKEKTFRETENFPNETRN